MKYDKIERIALWVIVVILAIAVFFPRRGSGFVLQPGTSSNLISIMDLKEFSLVPSDKINVYKSNILTTSNLMSIANTTGPIMGKLDMMLTAGLNMRPQLPTTTPSIRPQPPIYVPPQLPPVGGPQPPGPSPLGGPIESFGPSPGAPTR